MSRDSKTITFFFRIILLTSIIKVVEVSCFYWYCFIGMSEEELSMKVDEYCKLS